MTTARRSAAERLFPFLVWIGEWRERSVVRADVFAGVTVALVLIPQSMAYARLAGLPAHYGLYASLLPPAVAALFGSSRQLATGPVAMASLISALAVQGLARGDVASMVSLSVALAFLVGLVRLILGVFRMGSVASFLSRPVVVGFTNAAVLIIVTSQLGSLLGIEGGEAGRIRAESVWLVMRNVPSSVHGPTVCLAALAVLVQVASRRVWPAGPHVLVAVIVTTVAGQATGFTGAVVGRVPPGLPRWEWSGMSFATAAELLPTAGIITLIGLMEAVAIARTIATKTRQRFDVNQELIGQGVANLAGSVTQALVVAGSFSRSALNLAAGARTGMAAVVTSLLVAATLSWGTPLLQGIPLAALAAIVVVAVLPVFLWREAVAAWRTEWKDGAIAVVTFAVTLFTAPRVHVGVLTGVGLSLVLFLYRTMYPHVAVLSRHPDGTLRDLAVHSLPACRHVAVVRFDGQLYFGNSSFFEDEVLEAIAGKEGMRTVILDAAGINRIDTSGEHVLRTVARSLQDAGMDLLVARGKHGFLQTLERSGFVAFLGPDRFFRRAEDAIEHAWKAMDCDHVRECPLYRLPPAEE